tara:strand:+ start:2185 stop:2808 length:624 start_codon:yes stop_codon:yes gene_type:complete
MSPFDQAWALLKSPFVTQPFEDEVIDQPLYSGGDAGDDPLYWTKDPQEALMYALYGSAVLNDTEPGNAHGYDRNLYPDEQDFDTFTPPPLRQTVPTIFRADPHPTLNEPIHLDPMADDWYRNYMSQDLAYEPLPNEEVVRLINEYLDEWGGAGSAGFTSGQYYPPEMREKHIEEALERLKNRQAGRLTLPEGTEDIYGWSRTDPPPR